MWPAWVSREQVPGANQPLPSPPTPAWSASPHPPIPVQQLQRSHLLPIQSPQTEGCLNGATGMSKACGVGASKAMGEGTWVWPLGGTQLHPQRTPGYHQDSPSIVLVFRERRACPTRSLFPSTFPALPQPSEERSWQDPTMQSAGVPKLGRLGSVFTAGSEQHSRRGCACNLLWSPGEILPAACKQKEGAIVRRAPGHRSSRQCEDGAAQRLICSHRHQACPTWFPLGQRLTKLQASTLKAQMPSQDTLAPSGERSSQPPSQSGPDPTAPVLSCAPLPREYTRHPSQESPSREANGEPAQAPVTQAS